MEDQTICMDPENQIGNFNISLHVDSLFLSIHIHTLTFGNIFATCFLLIQISSDN